MKQRIITGAVMFIIFAPLYLLGGWFSTALIMFLAYFGTYELINMYQTKNNIPNICKYIVPLFSLLIVLVSGIVSGGFGTFIDNLFDNIGLDIFGRHNAKMILSFVAVVVCVLAMIWFFRTHFGYYPFICMGAVSEEEGVYNRSGCLRM